MQESTKLLKRLLQEVQTMSVRQLKQYFEELMGFPPRTYNCDTLRRRISYKLQERYLGALSPNDCARLEELADQDQLANLGTKFIDYYPGMRIVPKTRFTRKWHGKTYVVTFIARNKYQFDGKEYKSLTAISNFITGTHWSGTTFFGVKHNE